MNAKVAPMNIIFVLIPIAILVAVGLKEGFDSEVINGGLGLILTVLANLVGTIGFYIPGWCKGKSSS